VRVSFGEFDLDTTTFELRRAGRRVSLEPQVFDVLVLVRRRDRVVVREEFLDTAWWSRFVSEPVLATGSSRCAGRWARTGGGSGSSRPCMAGVTVSSARCGRGRREIR
jgi:hypothetical protein